MKRVGSIIVVVFFYTTATYAEENTPDNGIIIGVAQQFVVEKLNLPAESRFAIAFDITYIHPQPEPGYWAVVGGFMAELTSNQYEPHSYVVAIRLLCQEYRSLDCWRLDKFAIDNQIIFDIDKQIRGHNT